MSQYEDFIIDQGTDFTIQLELVDANGSAKDLTGYSSSSQIRKTYSSSDSDAVSFSTQFQSPRSSGVINLTITNSQTGLMKAGRYVYDVEISSLDSADNTIVERILEGQITMSPSVTKT